MNRSVEIVAYDPAWPERFRLEANRIRRALGDVAVRIEHVGSTSVPDLPAKPIVDIQISVRSFEPQSAYGVPLERLGYTFRPDVEEPQHRFYYYPVGLPRLFNVHVCEVGGDWEYRHLLFRDYLRTHPEAAAQYVALKRQLAEQFRYDVDAYANAKTSFIREIECQAARSQRRRCHPIPRIS